MKIYHYDPITKEYAGESDARLDPLESKKQGENVYLIPANTATEKPPIPNENEIVMFDNNNWSCVVIPEPADEKEELSEEEKEALEREALITQKIRELAINALIEEGKLTEAGEIKTKG
jgi:hypothetical protein